MCYCAALLLLQNKSCRKWGKLFYYEVERLLSQPQYRHCPSFGIGNVKRIGEYKKIQLTDTVTSLVFKGHQGFYQA